jgi:hypothetical protein
LDITAYSAMPSGRELARSGHANPSANATQLFDHLLMGASAKAAPEVEVE